jgi:hypothetical protein
MIYVISKHEEQLRLAQLSGDVAELDELISDELQFIFHDGSFAAKQMDLEAHRSKILKIQSIDFSEQNIQIFGDTAVVTVKAKLVGNYSGHPFQGMYRYCRTWLFRNQRWQIIRWFQQ